MADAQILEQVVRDMIAHGHGMLPFVSGPYKDEVFDGMARLVAEDPEYRAQWCFDLGAKGDADDGLVDAGKKERVVTGEEYDDKYYLHYRPWLPWLLRNRGVDTDRYADWLGACGRLYRATGKLNLHLAEAMDRVVPGQHFAEGYRLSESLGTLRVLWYAAPIRTPSGEEVLAQKHTDRCAWTQHIAETHPGLVLDGELVEVSPEHSAVFAGKKLQLATGGRIVDGVTTRMANMAGGTFIAAPHEVIDTRGRGVHRMSAVRFLHVPTPIPARKAA